MTRLAHTLAKLARHRLRGPLGALTDALDLDRKRHAGRGRDAGWGR